MGKILVSVICCTFNHEKYIKSALEGFVLQKTNFDFEVIVHDDCSTDKTREIIEEYAKNYPNIIYPIFQNENQYSKGIDIIKTFILPRTRGKYIAICEGDDCWIKDDKLQKQVNYLEHNKCVSMCTHNTQRMKENGLLIRKWFNNSKIDKNYDAQNVIEANGGGLFHTSSFMCKKDLYLKLPKDFNINGVGDYPLAIWMAINGPVHYINETMSLYRVGSINSWETKTINNKNIEKRKQHYIDVIVGVKQMDRYTNYKYSKSFEYIILKSLFEIDVIDRKLFKVLFSKKYKSIYEKYKGIRKIKLYIRVFLTCAFKY